MSILIFIVILLVLVLVHEFGHFFTAKLFGMKVEEFGFGFPPKLFGVKKGETEYTFNVFPIGGFVKILGESPEDLPVAAGENIVDGDENRKFYNQAKWKQAIVLFAGIFMNFILAWLLFSLGLTSGLPTSAGTLPSGVQLSDVHLTITNVVAKSPAEKAGLQPGDQIDSIAIHPQSDPQEQYDLQNPTAEEVQNSVINTADEVLIRYERAGKQNYVTINPNKSPTGEQYIGISMDMIGTAKLPVLKAFSEGLALTASTIKDTVYGLYMLIHDALVGRGSLSAVSGPVGMVGIVGQAYQFGFAYLLSFAALISVNLGIINLVPFPALDGGRLFFLLIEKIKGSRMNPKVANTANTIGFGLLILLMVVITYHDVVKLF